MQIQEVEIYDSCSENGRVWFGWTRDLLSNQWKLNRNSRMMPCCKVFQFLAEKFGVNSEASRNDQRF